MVVIFTVYGPKWCLVGISRGNTLNRGFRGQHGMILIVVPVHAISADREDVGQLIKVGPQMVHVIVRAEIRWIGLGYPDHGAI